LEDGVALLADETVVVEARMKLSIGENSYEVELQPDAIAVNGTAYKVAVLRDQGEATVRVGGRPYKVKVQDDGTVMVDFRPYTVSVSGRATVGKQSKSAAKAPPKAHVKGAVRALMPGKVLSVRVQEGELVGAGTVLLILEAMKMENEIKAPQEGTIKRVAVQPGQTVNNGDVLVVME
jgi:biotin carboxyl carrier protein